MENSDESQSQSKLLEMNNLLEGTTPLMRSGESSLGSSSHNLVMGFDGIFRSEKCVKLFQDFLKEQNQVNYLLFWLAVNGFKKVPEPSKADHLARIIYRSFIKSNSEKPVKLNSSTSHEIKVLIDSTPITRSIFDKAHCEVESLLKTTFYPQFTKWDGASKFEFVDGSPSVDNQPGSNFLSQFGLHDSSPANTDSCGDIRVPTNPNVSMASSSALLSGSNPTSTTTTSAGVAPQTTLTGLSAGGGAESESGRCSESACGANGVCAEAQLNNNNCACQQASKSHGLNHAETSLGKESSSNSLLINQQCHFPVPPSKTHQGFSSSSRHQRRGKSQENSIDHRIVKDAANVKLGHHSRPKSNTAAVAANAIGNSISGSSGKKQAGVKSDLACRKPPEILPPHQFAAILIRKLEELQMKQQGLKLASDSQSMCASAMHERNNMESLRHQLLAVSGASSQQVSDMASSSQEDDPNNIIDSHVSRVFRDTQDCGGTSPPVTYSPSTGSICVECTPGSAMLLTKLSRDVSSRVLHGQTGGKLGPNSRRCNRFETCSNLSMSSGVDSGCFDVSSQFSTDSRESDSRSRLSVLNWMQSSSRENSLTGVCPTSKHANNGHFVSGSPCPASRHSNATSGLSRGSSATASRANTRWASLSPHRNMHYSVNNSNNNVIGSLMSAGNAPTLNHNFNPHPLNHALHSMGGVASCQFATSNSCSQPCICACEANVHTLPTYSQKKSRSNSAERPFSGAALQVFKQEIPKATTAESIIGMQSASSEGVVAIAPPQFNQSTGSKTPKQQHKEYSDVNLPSDKKKSSTWSKQRSGDKSRHFNTCAHHLGLSQFQDPFSSHAEVQEDSAFDESCAEDSFFSTCSTEMLKKGGAVCHSSQSSGASSQVMTSSVSSSCPNSTVVAYFFCGEPIPYRTVVQSKLITLADFKSLLTRKGNYRYFFKMRSDEIEIGGIVNEEVTEDDAVLPFFDGKIIGRIEKQSSC